METVVLTIHLVVALCLIGVVLLQRSEGGGLGMGGGGGVVSARGAATALGKLTWAIAVAFIATSLTLVVLAARNSADTSVIDRLGVEVPTDETTGEETDGSELLPPATNGDPLVPPPVE